MLNYSVAELRINTFFDFWVQNNNFLVKYANFM